MKRTTVMLDAEIVELGKKLTGITTTRALIDLALRELVRNRRQRRILKLKGKIDWQGDLGQMRGSRFLKN